MKLLKAKALSLYFLLMSRRNWLIILLTLIIPSLIFILIAVLLLIISDPTNLSKAPSQITQYFFPDNLTKYTVHKNPIWFGIAPDSDDSHQFSQYLMNNLGRNYEIKYFENQEYLQQYIANANLFNRDQNDMNLLSSSLADDIKSLQIPGLSIDSSQFDEHFNSMYRAQVLGITQQESREILFGISLDISPRGINHSVYYHHFAINRFHHQRPDKQNMKFVSQAESPFFSTYSFKLQTSIERALIQLKTGSADIPQIEIAPLPQKSPRSQTIWEQSYFSVLLIFNFVYVFACVILAKFRQNSYVMLKKLGIGDVLFWINMWLYLFIIIYLSLVLFFSFVYIFRKLPFATYNYGLVWIISLPLAFAQSSFVCFLGMAIKNEKLLIIFSAIMMICFSVFPTLICVLSGEWKPIWDPSLIPQPVTLIVFVLLPLYSCYSLLEMLITILPAGVITGMSLNQQIRFTFSYIFSTKWQNQDRLWAWKPANTYKLISFDLHWIIITVQVIFYLALAIFLSVFKSEHKQIGRPINCNLAKKQMQKPERDIILKVVNLKKKFKKKTVLNGISFEIQFGKTYGIIGSSASGKTTLINIIAGQLKADVGDDQFVIVNGYNILQFSGLQQQQQFIGVCPQDKSNIFDNLTINDNITLCMKLMNNTDTVLSNYLLKSLNLHENLHKSFKQLSGGMQRRFALLMALIQKPKLLLLDEMTANVDPLLKRQIWDAISYYKTVQQCSIILTSHDSQEIVQMADEVLFLKDGTIQLQSSVQQINERANAIKLIFADKTKLPEIQNVLAECNIKYLLQNQIRGFTLQIVTVDPQLLQKLSKLLCQITQIKYQSYPINEIIYQRMDEVFEDKQHFIQEIQVTNHHSNQIGYQFKRIFFEAKNQYFSVFILVFLFSFIIALLDFIIQKTTSPSNGFNDYSLVARNRASAVYIMSQQLSGDITVSLKSLLLNHSQYKMSPSYISYIDHYYNSPQYYHDIIGIDVLEKYALTFGDQQYFKPKLDIQNYHIYLTDDALQQLPQDIDQISANRIQIDIQKIDSFQSNYKLSELSKEENDQLHYLNDYQQFKYFPISINPLNGFSVSPYITRNNTLELLREYYKKQQNNNNSYNFSSLSQEEKEVKGLSSPLGIIDLTNSQHIYIYMMIPPLRIGKYYSGTDQIYRDGQQNETFFSHSIGSNTNSLLQRDIDETYFISYQNDLITKVHSSIIKKQLKDNDFSFQATYITQPQYSDLPTSYPDFWMFLLNASFIAYYFIPFTLTIILIFSLKSMHGDLITNYHAFLDGIGVSSTNQILCSLFVNWLYLTIKYYLIFLMYIVLVYSETFANWFYWLIPPFCACSTLIVFYFMIILVQDFGTESLYLCFVSLLVVVINAVVQPNLLYSGLLSIIFPGLYYISLCRQTINYEEIHYYTIVFGIIVQMLQIGILLLIKWFLSSKNQKLQRAIAKSALQEQNEYCNTDVIDTPDEVITVVNDEQSVLKQSMAERGVQYQAQQQDDLIMKATNIQAFYSKKQLVLHDFNMKIFRNQTTCLIGINGCGKSTFLKCLVDSEVSYTGNIQLQAKIGIVPQDDTCNDALTVRQNLLLMCCFSNRKVDDVIKQFGLEKEQFVKAGDLSSGQRRRLTIAMVVVTNPTLLILDEVTVGLDYELKMQVWSVILQLQNCSIMAITHDMDEVDTLADQTCILDKGRIMVQNSLENIKKMGNCNYNLQLFGTNIVDPPDKASIRWNQDGSAVISFAKDWLVDEIFGYLHQLKESNVSLSWSLESVQMESVFMDVLQGNYQTQVK